jgi:hypothetical protein
LLERRDSPWYPSLTLYRQEPFGDWRGVMQEVRKDLAQLADLAAQWAKAAQT